MAKTYSLGFGFLGNGTTVWNRAEQQDGDYKTIAHIEDNGVVQIYDKDMPPEVVALIQRAAEQDATQYQQREDVGQEQNVIDFSHRYSVGHGTSIWRTFATAAELNNWFDNQGSYGRYFCRLYDGEKGISILGSEYMWLKTTNRWTD